MVRGFRSTFRDWAAECTNFTNEVCEAALAHVVEHKAEAAYRCGDLFDKRRKLMYAWAGYAQRPRLENRCIQAIGATRSARGADVTDCDLPRAVIWNCGMPP